MKLVTAAIIERDGKVLIARRAPASKLAGQWEFPGGKVEEGETLQQCLVRELKEELGIDVTVGAHVVSSDFRYDHGGFRIEAFRVTWVSGALTLKDHDKIEWIKASELGNFSLLPADIPIAQKLIHYAATNPP